jgi:hypothetical protein
LEPHLIPCVESIPNGSMINCKRLKVYMSVKRELVNYGISLKLNVMGLKKKTARNCVYIAIDMSSGYITQKSKVQ